MRLHDINVVTDLNEHDPNSSTPDEPVEYDETGIPTEIEKRRTDLILEPIAVSVTAVWQVVDLLPWLVLSFTTDSIDFIMKVDLLGTIQLDTLAISIPIIEAMSQAELDVTAEKVNDYTRLVFSFTVPFIVGQLVVQSLRFLENMSWDPVKMGIGMMAWLALWLSYITILENLVRDGELHPWGVAYNFLGIAVSLLPGLRSGLSTAGNLVRTLQKFYLGSLLESVYTGGRIRSAIWTTAIALLKVFAFATCLTMYVQLISHGFNV